MSLLGPIVSDFMLNPIYTNELDTTLFESSMGLGISYITQLEPLKKHNRPAYVESAIRRLMVFKSNTDCIIGELPFMCTNLILGRNLLKVYYYYSNVARCLREFKQLMPFLKRESGIIKEPMTFKNSVYSMRLNCELCTLKIEHESKVALLMLREIMFNEHQRMYYELTEFNQ